MTSRSTAIRHSRTLWRQVAGVAETTSTTSWTVTTTLTENQTYYWRARAFDGSLYSDWAEAWFVVNTANDAPGAPALYSPLDGATIATFTPTLSVANAVDPDSDVLTYEFEVSNGATVVWSRTAVPQDPIRHDLSGRHNGTHGQYDLPVEGASL